LSDQLRRSSLAGLRWSIVQQSRVATLIAKAHGFVWQPYVGAVVFTSVDDEGETLSLREGQVEALLTTARLGGAVVVDARVDEAEGVRDAFGGGDVD